MNQNIGPVTVKVDGVSYTISAGRYTMKEFRKAINRTEANQIASLTLTTSAPTQGTTINANDSFIISGGEVMTSTKGI